MTGLFSFFAVSQINNPQIMKKLILSIALLAGITLVACGDDDTDVTTVTYVGCQICEIKDTPENAPPSDIIDQDYEVCIDEDGIAYVDNGNTNVAADYYFSLFCGNEFVAPPIPVTNCVTCATEGAPPGTGVQICKGPKGTAVIDNEDTEMPYQQYIDAYEQTKDLICQ